MREKPRTVELLGKQYESVHDTDSDTGNGYIELADRVTGEPVARVSYRARDKSMTLDLYGKPQSRAFVEALFERAELALA